tara:strand:+ start:224 stop:640 length:417 start_codon:yes stop_codon:yes gene_type:complete
MKQSNYKLNENEQFFMIRFLANNGCGAQTPDSLLGDNYSCQSMEDFNELFENLSDQQIGGYLSILEQKGVIYADERIGEGGHFVKKGKNVIFVEEDLPTLWWATEDYLEGLNPNWKFCLADTQMRTINGNTPCEVYDN